VHQFRKITQAMPNFFSASGWASIAIKIREIVFFSDHAKNDMRSAAIEDVLAIQP